MRPRIAMIALVVAICALPALRLRADAPSPPSSGPSLAPAASTPVAHSGDQKPSAGVATQSEQNQATTGQPAASIKHGPSPGQHAESEGDRPEGASSNDKSYDIYHRI